jgi:hypothetical protein
MSRFLKEMPQDLLEGLDAPDFFDQRPRYRSYFHEQTARYESDPEHEKGQIKSCEMSTPQPKTIAELKAYIRQKERTAGTIQADSSAGPIFKAGMRVRHEQFGDGIVLSRERTGNEIKLTVTFSRVGRKSLIERYAKLKAL